VECECRHIELYLLKRLWQHMLTCLKYLYSLAMDVVSPSDPHPRFARNLRMAPYSFTGRDPRVRFARNLCIAPYSSIFLQRAWRLGVGDSPRRPGLASLETFAWHHIPSMIVTRLFLGGKLVIPPNESNIPNIEAR
jgi:hypothetical protein